MADHSAYGREMAPLPAIIQERYNYIVQASTQITQFFLQPRELVLLHAESQARTRE